MLITFLWSDFRLVSKIRVEPVVEVLDHIAGVVLFDNLVEIVEQAVIDTLLDKRPEAVFVTENVGDVFGFLSDDLVVQVHHELIDRPAVLLQFLMLAEFQAVIEVIDFFPGREFVVDHDLFNQVLVDHFLVTERVLLDPVLVNPFPVLELGHITLRAREGGEEDFQRVRGENIVGEFDGARRVTEVLHCLDSRDVREEPSAARVHQHPVMESF